MGDVTKACNGCRLVLSREAFAKDRRNRDGLQGRCKECNALYREQNRERMNEYFREHYAANRERRAELGKLWYEANKEQHAAAGARYREEHREEIAEQQKAYRERNAERISEYRKSARLKRRVVQARRRARTVAQMGVLDELDVWAMLRDQGGLCAYCERPLNGEYQIDHIVPLKDGGPHDAMNVALACVACNASKGALPVERFMERLMGRTA